ncbi:uroporphyrinogen-III C-methyltransferase [Fusobacterium equinum]|uniref:uroporphyrinogen-III C-methyltransferase n=1 Tax=Fusobacterium equinum TaxID=134605 RepID=A0A133N882_9FUSO|nr:MULTISPECIES: uroporphyrinogen-III C-methyltransferase [Fusobacterium]KXA12521.1 uroporphyrinogen-III C-methyltransferase [Fusobacterium equinum]
MKKKVYLVGAGPGDAGLFTLKGKQLLEEADCIIYDRLIPMEILNFAKKDAELIYLGKENTEGGLLQEKINHCLIEKALEGKMVVRLKGGDSFVFGRGGEEILALVEQGIDFEVVPGITSSISVPAYAGIPVTHRDVARSFHVFTGHTMKDGTWHNFEVLAKLEGTLVFLMGVKNLDKIVNGLIQYGRDSKTPIAIIEKGATEQQKVHVGTLKNIVTLAKERDVKAPAIIIIGEVVSLQEKLNWFEATKKKKILVTRDIKQAPDFSEKLQKHGFFPIEFPLLEIQKHTLSFLKDFFQKYSVILFNSPNGIRYFLEAIPDLRMIAHCKIGVVGRKTREVAESYKLIPDFMPKEYCVHELAKLSKEYSQEGDHILIFTSDISPCDCEKYSKEYNRKYEKFVLYSTSKKEYSKEEMEQKIKEVDIITLLSSSTVEALYENLEGDLSILEGKQIASIGPVTSKTLRKYGFTVDYEATIYDTNGLVEILKEANNVSKN